MVVCIIKGCNEKAYNFGGVIAFCPTHMEEVANFLAGVGKAPPAPVAAVKAVKPEKPVTKPAAKPKPAKPKPAMKELTTDAEIEALLRRRVEKKGQVTIESILKNLKVAKGSYPTATERLVAAMKSFAERNPGLEVVGSGTKTTLRRKAQQAQQQPQTTQQETTSQG